MIFYGLLTLVLVLCFINCDPENHVLMVIFDLDGGNINGNTVFANWSSKESHTNDDPHPIKIEKHAVLQLERRGFVSYHQGWVYTITNCCFAYCSLLIAATAAPYRLACSTGEIIYGRGFLSKSM